MRMRRLRHEHYRSLITTPLRKPMIEQLGNAMLHIAQQSVAALPQGEPIDLVNYAVRLSRPRTKNAPCRIAVIRAAANGSRAFDAPSERLPTLWAPDWIVERLFAAPIRKPGPS
jgi:hypothetical protein